MSVKKFYEVEGIVKCGANTREAVSEAVSLVKQFVIKECYDEINSKTLGFNVKVVFDNARTWMLHRLGIEWTLIHLNQLASNRADLNLTGDVHNFVFSIGDELTAINNYIINKVALKRSGYFPKGKLSSDERHQYVSLIVHKFEEALAK